jgi:hypothetical protein
MALSLSVTNWKNGSYCFRNWLKPMKTTVFFDVFFKTVPDKWSDEIKTFQFFSFLLAVNYQDKWRKGLL